MPVKYSYSKINTFKTCPQQYKIIYLDKIRNHYESIEAFMGKRVHEVLEWLYLQEHIRSSIILFDVLMDKYKEFWDDNWHDDIFIARCKYNKEIYNKYVDCGNPEDSSIFILGMPRSGTTLVEQILSSHHKVFGGDEQVLIPGLLQKKFGNKNLRLYFENIIDLFYIGHVMCIFWHI